MRKAVIWLARHVDKPILKLTEKDYNEHHLQDLLAEHGEVKAFADVQCRLYDDTLPVTTCTIPGSIEPEKEIWLIQHLHEVGAHDNASGVGTALEAVRSLKTLIGKGVLDPPKRTIRVICSWEIIGFLAHLCANPGITENVICGP